MAETYSGRCASMACPIQVGISFKNFQKQLEAISPRVWLAKFLVVTKEDFSDA
jgi:hypothetical protein